ncbi:MAG: gamma-glutamyltransferase [Planctomycetota bacterium]|nr:MAG: gamma-glutamyltransferase [Planctomycetota bacterium]
MSRILIALALTGGALMLPADHFRTMDRITGRSFATRSEVLATNGMAATSQPLATQAALEILRAGGNAVDAAIAANAVLALTEPTGCGLGGDLFALLWSAEEKKLVGLNASGRSPASLSLAYLKKHHSKGIPALGPIPVTVPGCVDGWFQLHDRFGKLSMAEILAPAIRYAREGFPVTELIAYYWSRSVPMLRRFPGFEEQFTVDGRGPRKGEIFRNPNLAATLELLAEKGRDAFYKGEIAGKIDAYMKENGGFLRLEDLAAHQSEWVEPVSTSYRGYDLWELPPNGQGIAALQILNILEGFDLQKMGFGSADYVHHFTEAKKLAFEDRARFYADPAFANVPVQGLISKEYAAKRRKLIQPKKAARRYDAGKPALEHGDTVYLCTADRDGNMVSLIQSNYRGMGSGMSPGDLGFILQDRGELFSLEEGHPNVFEPGKRPFHTIIPAFLTQNGKPIMAFGVMGGATQPQAHAQILINLLDFGMNLQEAGDAPRMVHNGSSQPTGEKMRNGGFLSLESGIGDEVRRELEKRGHRLRRSVGGFGGYQAIWRDPESGVYYGASESRKDGHAAGF